MIKKSNDKRRAIIFVVAAFVVGAIVAGGSVGYFLKKRLASQQKYLDYGFECQPAMSTASISLQTLLRLRSEPSSSPNSNAAEYLETQLDFSIADIGKYVERLPLQDHASFPAVTNVLLAAKNYRARSSHTNQDNLIQAEVKSAFSLVHEKRKH